MRRGKERWKSQGKRLLAAACTLVMALGMLVIPQAGSDVQAEDAVAYASINEAEAADYVKAGDTIVIKQGVRPYDYERWKYVLVVRSYENYISDIIDEWGDESMLTEDSVQQYDTYKDAATNP